VVFNLGLFAFFLEVVRASDKNIHFFYIYISCMEPLFVVANIIGLPDKNDSPPLYLILFLSVDYEHYNILSVIMTNTLLLCLATHE